MTFKASTALPALFHSVLPLSASQQPHWLAFAPSPLREHTTMFPSRDLCLLIPLLAVFSHQIAMYPLPSGLCSHITSSVRPSLTTLFKIQNPSPSVCTSYSFLSSFGALFVSIAFKILIHTIWFTYFIYFIHCQLECKLLARRYFSVFTGNITEPKRIPETQCYIVCICCSRSTPSLQAFFLPVLCSGRLASTHCLSGLLPSGLHSVICQLGNTFRSEEKGYIGWIFISLAAHQLWLCLSS